MTETIFRYYTFGQIQALPQNIFERRLSEVENQARSQNESAEAIQDTLTFYIKIRTSPAHYTPIRGSLIPVIFRVLYSNRHVYNIKTVIRDVGYDKACMIVLAKRGVEDQPSRIFYIDALSSWMQQFIDLYNTDSDIPEDFMSHMYPEPNPNYIPSTEDINFLRETLDFTQFIEQNSDALLIKETTSRFSGAQWYKAIQETVVILAGVGGIGSYVGFLLARLNPKALFIYDDDIVEEANMSGQLYSKIDIGARKVDALARMVNNYACYNSIFAISERFTEDKDPSDIMICGFDNMEARKLFFTKWKEHVKSKPAEERHNCLFIDGRLAAEELQVYCVTGDDTTRIENYEGTLFTNEEAEPTVCSYKQTSYMANMIGSIIVNLFTNFVANNELGFCGRDLPYYTSYNGLIMKFNIEG